MKKILIISKYNMTQLNDFKYFLKLFCELCLLKIVGIIDTLLGYKS